MLDDKFKSRVKRLIEAQYQERWEQIRKEINLFKNQAAARGIYYSGATMKKIKEICESEIKIRSVIIWQSMVRVHRILGSITSSTLAKEFKEYFDKLIKETAIPIERTLKEEINKIGMGHLIDLSLMPSCNKAITKHGIEIELYVDSLSETPSKDKSKEQKSTEYHFYGSVGAVQTGYYSTANIVQNISSEDKKALINAIEEVKHALENITEITESQRNELLEIAEESKEQIQSKSCNKTKLFNMLYTLAISIQAFANARPAYNTIKSALVSFGISLP